MAPSTIASTNLTGQPWCQGSSRPLRPLSGRGAIGAFLSGAGPTILAICQRSEKHIGSAMVAALRKAGLDEVDVKVLSADNGGITTARFLPSSAKETRC